MEAALRGVLGAELYERVHGAKVLVVGAGGIGCELLKNLVLSGFKHIEVIDLDTIDVSNLNRQFLFQKQHVGQSKAQVAVQAVGRMAPGVHLVAHHADVKGDQFGPDYVKGFGLVLNALDNLSARNHVNRLCLAADVPLVESGTAGYLGQVTVIKKGRTECFECQPKPPPKKHPVCTIRNTPSLPIHCIVWAKYLFQQLYGRADDDSAISPNTEDPEAAGEGAGKEKDGAGPRDGEVSVLRRWAASVQYEPQGIFDRVFRADIETLLSMSKLWEKRRPPTPLGSDSLPDTVEQVQGQNQLPSQQLWPPRKCADVFMQCVQGLTSRREGMGDPEAELDWDKDDQLAMDFVTAAANLRAHAFGIPLKSPFDVKSMAGNIIPAIATTNAIIAGLIVQEALNILAGRWDSCQTTYLWRTPNARKRLLVPDALAPPNPKCYVCAPKPSVEVHCGLNHMTLNQLQHLVLVGKLGMVAPDVMHGASILLSSEEGDTPPHVLNNTLAGLGLKSGIELQVDDFLQQYTLTVVLRDRPDMAEGTDFEVVGSAEPQAAASEEGSKEEEEEEEPMIVEVVDTRKRKADEDVGPETKQPRLSD